MPQATSPEPSPPPLCALRVMDERERARLRALATIREKQEKAFERGGGKALQAGLEEQVSAGWDSRG